MSRNEIFWSSPESPFGQINSNGGSLKKQPQDSPETNLNNINNKTNKTDLNNINTTIFMDSLQDKGKTTVQDTNNNGKNVYSNNHAQSPLLSNSFIFESSKNKKKVYPCSLSTDINSRVVYPDNGNNNDNPNKPNFPNVNTNTNNIPIEITSTTNKGSLSSPAAIDVDYFRQLGVGTFASVYMGTIIPNENKTKNLIEKSSDTSSKKFTDNINNNHPIIDFPLQIPIGKTVAVKIGQGVAHEAKLLYRIHSIANLSSKNFNLRRRTTFPLSHHKSKNNNNNVNNNTNTNNSFLNSYNSRNILQLIKGIDSISSFSNLNPNSNLIEIHITQFYGYVPSLSAIVLDYAPFTLQAYISTAATRAVALLLSTDPFSSFSRRAVSEYAAFPNSTGTNGNTNNILPSNVLQSKPLPPSPLSSPLVNSNNSCTQTQPVISQFNSIRSLSNNIYSSSTINEDQSQQIKIQKRQQGSNDSNKSGLKQLSDTPNNLGLNLSSNNNNSLPSMNRIPTTPNLGSKNQFQQQYGSYSPIMSSPLTSPNPNNVSNISTLQTSNLSASVPREVLGPAAKPDEPVVGLSRWQTWSRELISALAFLQANDIGIVHGDIKSENVLVTPNMDVQLCDFSSAIDLLKNNTNENRNGNINKKDIFSNDSMNIDKKYEDSYLDPEGIEALTVHFAAPELLRSDIKESPSFKSDAFSLGLVLLHMATGREPYDDNHYAFYHPSASSIISATSDNGMYSYPSSPNSVSAGGGSTSSVSSFSSINSTRMQRLMLAKRGEPLECLDSRDKKRLIWPIGLTLRALLVDRISVMELLR